MVEGWEHEYQEQTEYLQAQLTALNGLPPQRRRRFQLLVLRCQGCEDVMLEVLDTRPYAVVRTRPLHPSTRRGGWRWLAIPWPSGSDSPEREAGQIPVACRCRQSSTTLRAVLGDLRAGRRSGVVPRGDKP